MQKSVDPGASLVRRGLRRRDVLIGVSLLCLPRVAFGQAGALAGAAASGLTQSLASSIGRSLANGIVGSVGAFAFGQLLSAAGLDMSGQAAMLGKLNEILDRLKELQETVDRLRTSLLTALSRVSYDVAIGQVNPLISLNKTLSDAYQSMLAGPASEAPGAIDDIKTLTDSSLLRGLRTWHTAIIGGNGTGLIEAWGRVVFNAHAGWYAADAAQAVQDHWNFIDAQQAMTVNFLIEHFNATNQRRRASDTLRQWHANREEQVRALRGMVDDRLPYTTIGADGGLVSGSFAVRRLPPFTAVSVPTNIMWCLVIGDAVAQAGDELSFQAEIAPDIRAVTVSTGVGASEVAAIDPANAWQLMSADTMAALIRECGGSVNGNSDRPDHFVDAMRRRGFTFPLEQARIWTSDTGDRPILELRHARAAFVEGEGWWHYNWDAEARAMVLLGRRLAPNEQDNYWFANA